MVPSGGRPAAGQRDPARSRAQTATIGLILVFGMVIAGSVLVVMFGSSAIDDTQETLSLERAQKSLTQLDSKAALVALENADTQQLNMPRMSGDNLEVRSTGQLTITATDLDTLSTSTMLQQDLGALVYEQGETTLAYQGGGVWKQTDGSRESVMVSPPEFHYRNGTLTLPVIVVSGDASSSDRINVGFGGSSTAFPDPAAGSTNPLLDKEVKVTITSEYYKGWGQYFETRTDGNVEYDHANNEVTLTLVSPIGQQRITAATASLAASGTFEIHGSANSGCSGDDDLQNGGKEMYANSYNSSDTPDDYCDQASAGNYGHEGDIVYGDSVDLKTGSGSAWIHGNVVSGGEVTVGSGSGQPAVWGNINHTSGCNGPCSTKVKEPGASVNHITGVPKADQINGYVIKTVQDIEADNDNAGAAISSSNILKYNVNSPNNHVTLTSGRYFLKRIDSDNGNADTIELDTSGGEVIIGVEENIILNEGDRIEITGDGVARIFLLNDTSSGTLGLKMHQNTEITNAGDDATQFRLFGKDSLSAEIGDSGNPPARFVGVFYAPPGASGNGEVMLKNGEIFGGVLTGTTDIGSAGGGGGSDGGSLHYDEALANTQVINPAANVVKVTFLHVSINEIEIGG